MKAITALLEHDLKLKVNAAKSAVARPWQRKFLGYSMTWHKKPKLKIAQAKPRATGGENPQDATGGAWTKPETSDRTTQSPTAGLGCILLDCTRPPLFV